jgi:thiol-disulfide isomerase/thioredoxin
MRRVLPLALLMVAILLAIPQPTSAKPPKVKLTIAGGSLSKAIEITDPRILELTDTRLPAQQPPAGLHGYEVSSYFNVGNNELRRMAVVYYYPNSSSQQGYIYSPGEGEAWTVRDLATPMTAGRYGRWWFASPTWEQAIKPLIATAEASDLLSQVAQQYKNLAQYHIECVEESEFKGELSRSWNKQYRTLARDSETRYRFEFKAPYQWTTVISDGTTKWAAQPWRGEYTKNPATPLQPEKKEETDAEAPSEPAPDQLTLKLAQGVLNSLSKLDQHIKQAEILPSETIEAGGQRIACVVVRVVPETKSSRKYTSETIYWIDKEHKTVRKVRHVTQGELMPNEPGQPQTSDSTTQYMVVELGTPVAASLFRFNPLPNARLVDTLTPNFMDAGLTGRPAPSLKLKTLEGNDMDLASFHGKPVLVDFWASWCTPCRQQMPMLARLYGELKDKGLVLIGVTKDEEPDKAREFLAKNHYEWPNAQDDKDGHTSESWAAEGIPKLALVDKEGKITFFRAGYGTNEETELRAALHKVDPVFPETSATAPCR